ncbi:MAG: AAA family ATPase [Clostridia bacterium]
MRRYRLALATLAGVCVVGFGFTLLTGAASAGLIQALPRVLLAIALVSGVLFFVSGGRATAGAYQSARDAQPVSVTSDISFLDVAANEEARASLLELSDYLKFPEKFDAMGARMPRGVLLYGPPGTGKTLLARALAGEAGVPFFAMNGADFVQMYAGVGASRVRTLFQKARKAGKCVIFLDEIDAIGKKRDDGGSDERDQTLNALLGEMSGFHPLDGTLVVAATNRIDTLDQALTRPGRFDRQIEVGLPGRAERMSILALHAKNKPIAEGIDWATLAAQTVAFSGASLESLLNEAAICAARRGAHEIAQGDIDKAYLTGVAGADKRPIANRQELSVIALHEAGHALATHLLLPDHVLTRVSVLPTGKGAAGYSLSIPPERAMTDRAKLQKQVQVLLAGRAAEMLVGGVDTLTSGAMNDLQRASDLAATMVMDLGMVAEPCASLRQLQKALGGQASEAMQLARKLLTDQFDLVTQLLSDNVKALMALSEALTLREALSGSEVRQVLSEAA